MLFHIIFNIFLITSRLELRGSIQTNSTQVVANSQDSTIQFTFTYTGSKPIINRTENELRQVVPTRQSYLQMDRKD